MQSSTFKYYIHDSARSFRFQMFGKLNQQNLNELDGCWKTASASIEGRDIIIDLRGLHSADPEARQWLRDRAAKGTTYLVGTGISRDLLEDLHPEQYTIAASAKRPSWPCRFLAFLPFGKEFGLSLARCRG